MQKMRIFAITATTTTLLVLGLFKEAVSTPAQQVSIEHQGITSEGEGSGESSDILKESWRETINDSSNDYNGWQGRYSFIKMRVRPVWRTRRSLIFHGNEEDTENHLDHQPESNAEWWTGGIWNQFGWPLSNKYYQTRYPNILARFMEEILKAIFGRDISITTEE